MSIQRPYRLRYSLQIIYNIMSGPDVEAAQSWVREFSTHGGFEVLLGLLRSCCLPDAPSIPQEPMVLALDVVVKALAFQVSVGAVCPLLVARSLFFIVGMISFKAHPYHPTLHPHTHTITHRGLL